MQKLGNQTIKFNNKITVLETASIVGPKEADRSNVEIFR